MRPKAVDSNDTGVVSGCVSLGMGGSYSKAASSGPETFMPSGLDDDDVLALPPTPCDRFRFLRRRILTAIGYSKIETSSVIQVADQYAIAVIV